MFFTYTIQESEGDLLQTHCKLKRRGKRHISNLQTSFGTKKLYDYRQQLWLEALGGDFIDEVFFGLLSIFTLFFSNKLQQVFLKQGLILSKLWSRSRFRERVFHNVGIMSAVYETN